MLQTGIMKAIDAALEVALIVIRNGGSTAAAERTFTNVLKAYKLDGVVVVWRLDFVAVSREENGQAQTILRQVGAIGVNLTRASEATALGERLARGVVHVERITSEVERINTLVPPYARWVLVVAAACTAAFFSQIVGGDWGALSIVFVAVGIGQCLHLWLQARGIAVGIVTMVCGLLSACIAAAGLRLGLSQTVPATAIASVIYLAPGLPLINGFFDLVSQQYRLMGLQRITNAIFLFLLLSIAIGMAQAIVM